MLMATNKFSKASSEAPIAILLADHLVSEELEQVYGCLCKSSLELGGKILIQHALEELQASGIEQAIVLAGINAYELLDQIDRDSLPRLNVTILHSARSVEQALFEFKDLSHPNGMLVIEADRMRTLCVTRFLREAAKLEYSLLEAVVGTKKLGITLLKSTIADAVQNPMSINLTNVQVNYLDTLLEYRDLNYDLTFQRFCGAGFLKANVGQEIRMLH